MYYNIIPNIGKAEFDEGVVILVNGTLLKSKIMAAGYTQQSLAPIVKMSANSLNAKINGRKKFDTEEVGRICAALGIEEPSEKCRIFLA